MKNEVKDIIMDLERKTYEYFKEGMVDYALDLMSDRVMFFNPGEEILIGKESEREMLVAAIEAEDLEMSWEATDVHVGPSGDMAYAYGVIKIKMAGEVEQLEKYVTIWEKIDDQWKLMLQMRNSKG